MPARQYRSSLDRDRNERRADRALGDIVEESDAVNTLLEDEKNALEDLLKMGFSKRDVAKIDGVRRSVVFPKGSEGSWGRPDVRKVRDNLSELVSYFDSKKDKHHHHHHSPQTQTQSRDSIPLSLLEKVCFHGLRLRNLNDTDIIRVIESNQHYHHTREEEAANRFGLTGNGDTMSNGGSLNNDRETVRQIMLRKKTQRELQAKTRVMIDIMSFTHMIPTLVERNTIKRMFKETDSQIGGANKKQRKSLRNQNRGSKNVTEEEMAAQLAESTGMQEVCDRVFTEFSNKKLYRSPEQWPDYVPQQNNVSEQPGPPNEGEVLDPECPAVLTKSMIVEIFEFLEVYLSSRDVEYLFNQIDADKSGTIDSNEWREFFTKAKYRNELKKRACLKDSYLSEVFDEFDLSDRGYLCFEDLVNIVRFMNLNMSESLVKRLFEKIDSSGDDKIQKDEFLEFFEAIQNQSEMKEKLEQYRIKKERAVYIHLGYTALFLVLFVICLPPFLDFVEGSVFCGVALFGFFCLFLGIDKIDNIMEFIRMNMLVLTVARFRVFTLIVGVGIVIIVIVSQIEKATLATKRLSAGSEGQQKIPDALIYSLIGFFCFLVFLNIVAYFEKEKGCLRVMILGEEYSYKVDPFENNQYHYGNSNSNGESQSQEDRERRQREKNERRIASQLGMAYGVSGGSGFVGDDGPSNQGKILDEDGYEVEEFYSPSSGIKKKRRKSLPPNVFSLKDAYDVNRGVGPSAQSDNTTNMIKGPQFDRRRANTNIRNSLPPPLQQPSLPTKSVLASRMRKGFGTLAGLISPKNSPKRNNDNNSNNYNSNNLNNNNINNFYRSSPTKGSTSKNFNNSEAIRPTSQGGSRPWSSQATTVEAFRPLSEQGAREQIARASNSRGGVSSMGIIKGLDD